MLERPVTRSHRPARPAAGPGTRRIVMTLAGTLALALAGCSAGPARSVGAASPATESGGATGTATFAPLTLDNCGTTVALTTAPKRVVTIKSTSTEMLLSLGLQDLIVGTAFADGPPPDALTTAAAALPVLSEQVPGQEALLATDPDFVYGGWESNFSADGAGDRATLAGHGIGTYVSPAACKEPGYQPDPLTFDDVFAEIREAASIFGVTDRADALIATQKAQLAAVTAPAKPTTALWYSSGSDTPYVGAGIGAPEMMMKAAGLTNIFADVHDTWTSAGWEKIVAADPSVIVLVDASWNTAAKKIGLLEANPATNQLTAVREHRYLTVPFPAAEAGVRNVDAVVSLAKQLADLAPAS